ncbi:MAG: flagellar export chaperone FlgN [Acutalibacter sp.]
MSESSFESYLDLLEEIGQQLGTLIDLNHEKADAVRHDDLATLNEVIKKEQAISLGMRGLEQKRLKLAEDLSISQTPLSQLAGHAPQASQRRAKNISEHLQSQYQVYRAAAEVARNTLEVNLHEIEKFLEKSGAAPLQGALGYEPPEVELPSQMKTDFRA